MTPQEFSNLTFIAFKYCWFTFYGVTAIVSLCTLAFIIFTKRWHNTVLIALNLSILVDCVTFCIFESATNKKSQQFSIALSINTSSDVVSHWLVAYAYLRVIFDMEALLDKETHMSNYAKIDEISQNKKKLIVASVVAISVCLLDGLACYFGFIINSLFFIIGTQFVCVTLNFIFLGVWGYALIKLNSRIKLAEKLMPNRRMFSMHGTVLICYILFNLVFLVAISMAYFATGDKQAILYGIVNLSGIFAPLAECLGFFLVLFMMLPITG